MSIGITCFIEEVWFWGEMVLLDSALYFSGALFRFDEWQSVRFLSNSCSLRQLDPLSSLFFVIFFL
jgi:hypothetical protein